MLLEGTRDELLGMIGNLIEKESDIDFYKFEQICPITVQLDNLTGTHGKIYYTVYKKENKLNMVKAIDIKLVY